MNSWLDFFVSLDKWESTVLLFVNTGINGSNMRMMVIIRNNIKELYKGIGVAALGGVPAGAFCCIWVPIDVCKEQLQTQKELALTKYKGSIDALRSKSISQLYKGYWATLYSFGPFSALYFAFAQSAAGASAAFITTPLDLVKLRLQYEITIVFGIITLSIESTTISSEMLHMKDLIEIEENHKNEDDNNSRNRRWRPIMFTLVFLCIIVSRVILHTVVIRYDNVMDSLLYTNNINNNNNSTYEDNNIIGIPHEGEGGGGEEYYQDFIQVYYDTTERLYNMSTAYFIVNTCMGICGWRLLQIIHAHPRIALLEMTFDFALPHLINFITILFIVLMLFAQIGNWSIGASFPPFNSIFSALRAEWCMSSILHKEEKRSTPEHMLAITSTCRRSFKDNEISEVMNMIMII
ncbi:conserved hypothetical protein [Perkinsus marinus ATCC 50983]|uniref:Uncharacterized protein n=1 Tax=Perkinsus marinus (strain ATCC 50983 / TXsc) TaxID=423536 RepID=C5KMR0_PERM5|nr:conserved hypothetical protein [Perkinsus marinus ATCC 50983]EER14218.1 conserved hypothetical protein [Perkinsus marinus ATCC 50983]|eukprot:XP_002782423.1 conserved hypothetical protein [Perkinsus marinus ATCC 50983]